MAPVKLCFFSIVGGIAFTLFAGMGVPGSAFAQDRPTSVDESLLLAIDDIRIDKPAHSDATSLPARWKSGWRAIADAIEKANGKSNDSPTPPAAVERAVSGHAFLALNRNAESLRLFVSLQNKQDQNAWLAWTKQFLADNPESTIAQYLHIDALVRSARPSNDRQSAAVERIERWYESFKVEDSEDVSASEVMLMNLSGNLVNYKGAQFLFETAHYFVPALADAHANLGWRQLQESAYDKAEKEFETALEISPDFSLAKLGLAHTISRKSQHDEAKERATKLFEDAASDATIKCLSALVAINRLLDVTSEMTSSKLNPGTPGTAIQTEHEQRIYQGLNARAFDTTVSKYEYKNYYEGELDNHPDAAVEAFNRFSQDVSEHVKGQLTSANRALNEIAEVDRQRVHYDFISKLIIPTIKVSSSAYDIPSPPTGSLDDSAFSPESIGIPQARKQVLDTLDKSTGVVDKLTYLKTHTVSPTEDPGKFDMGPSSRGPGEGPNFDDINLALPNSNPVEKYLGSNPATNLGEIKMPSSDGFGDGAGNINEIQRIPRMQNEPFGGAASGNLEQGQPPGGVDSEPFEQGVFRCLSKAPELNGLILTRAEE